MTDRCAEAALVAGIGLLERAVHFLLGSLGGLGTVTAAGLSAPTPCGEWDLRALLGHVDDSLVALHEAIDLGCVGVEAASPESGSADPVVRVRGHATRLIGAWANAGPDRQAVAIGDASLTTGIVSGAGAVEIAVHGWDVAQAQGWDRPVPAALAEELLDLLPLFVAGDDRRGLFGPQVATPKAASPGDRLVAFLGRHPHPYLAARRQFPASRRPGGT